MVFVEGKQIIFTETFYAQHSDQVIVHAPLGESPINFRFTFNQPDESGGMSWSVDPNGMVQMSVTPGVGLGSVGERPTSLGQHSDGSTLYIMYTQQTFNAGSLIHLFLLKDATPAPAAA